jgi:hypothetical protein
MTTTVAPAATDLDAETVAQLRSERSSGVTIAELRKAYPSLSAATIRKAVGEPGQKPPTLDLPKLDAIVSTPKRKAKATTKVTTTKVAPVEPDYSKLPEAKREAARKAYEKAVAQYTGGVSEVPTVEKKAAPKSSAKAPATPKATAPKAERKPRPTIEPPSGFRSWDDAKLAARVLREKAKGSTIKAISAGLGLPEVERYFHRVSLVYREAADAKGIDRPRLSAEAIEGRRKAKAS